MIYINAQSKAAIESALASGTHAVLLHGPQGVGLKTIAVHYTSPHYIVSPELGTKASTVLQIGVEQIRELYSITRGKSDAPHFVLIDDADTMTLAAQNSLLKLLEEPPSATRFILTSHRPDRLLSTIRSRVQAIVVSPTNTAVELLGTVTDAARQKQLKFIAASLPAELYRLLRDEQYFRTTISEATLARKLIEATMYERLVLLADAKLDRAAALRVIERCIQFASYSPGESTIRMIRSLLQAYDAIAANGNIRLQMSAAMVY